MLLQTRTCRSGFLAVRVHYSVDPQTWTPDRIEAIRAALPGWRWRKEYEIDFTARGGQKVFDHFDPAVHVRLCPFDLESGHRYRVIDHGRRNPAVCLWWAEDRRTNTVYFYREYYQADATIADHCRAIRRLQHPAETRMTLIDPSTHRRTDAGLSTVADQYAAYGVRTIPADNNLAAGIEAVTVALTASLARWSLEHNRPHRWFADRLTNASQIETLADDRAVYFHPSMTNTIRELQQLSWDQDADHDDGRALCERIRGDDHCPDCVRYALLKNRAVRRGVIGRSLKRI